jgi:hypothetical protein
MIPADEVSVQARYEEWLRLNHLSMEPGLAGAEHHFIFDDQALSKFS